jgi:hypothetical protein
VINYEYGNKSEEENLKTYSNIYTEKSKVVKKLKAKSTRHFDNLLLKRKSKVIVESKPPPYKMKKFLKIDSKIKDHLSNFKTYLPLIKKNKQLDSLIKRTEEELNQLNQTTNEENRFNTEI